MGLHLVVVPLSLVDRLIAEQTTATLFPDAAGLCDGQGLS